MYSIIILMKKILIVEDDETVRNETAKLRALNNYEPIILENFGNAETEILRSNPDLILLDINIPFMNGRELLKNLRQNTDVPIIMVTSINSEIDEALTISYGADDYITKPYNPNILLLRIGAVLKRTKSQSSANNITKFGKIEFSQTKGTISNKNKNIELTKTEMQIMSQLIENRTQIVTRKHLMTYLWNNANYLNDNTLTVNISRLREKFAKLGEPDIIETRKGLGYILK